MTSKKCEKCGLQNCQGSNEELWTTEQVMHKLGLPSKRTLEIGRMTNPLFAKRGLQIPYIKIGASTVRYLPCDVRAAVCQMRRQVS